MSLRRKIFVFILSVTLVLLPVSYGSLVQVDTVGGSDWESEYAQRKSELQDKIDRINDELGQIGGTIGELNDKKGTLLEEKTGIEDQIKKTDNLITDIKLSISQIEWQIGQNQDKVVMLTEQIKEVFREIQKYENVSQLELILSSENLGQAISRLHNLSTFEMEVNGLRKQTEAMLKELEENKEILDNTKNSLEETRFLSQSKKGELDVLLEQTEGDEAKYQTLLASLKLEQDKFQANIVKIDKEKQAEAERRIAQEKKRADCEAKGGSFDYSDNSCEISSGGGGNSGSNAGGCVNETMNYSGIPRNTFTEPVNGYITQGFGCVDWGNGAHDGIDIANSYGTVIKAVGNGTVDTAGWLGGYGYAVIIKHTFGTRRVYSIYGHMKTPPPVKRGQAVVQGQTIGYMGTTGYSTGVHLHFAIADESYELTGSPNCNPRYGTSYTYCFNPVGGLFELW